MRIKIAEHLRYLPMGYFNSNSIGEISSITTNTMEILGDVAARVVMLTMQGILETSMIILMLFIFDWRIGLIAAAGVLIFFVVNSVMQNAGKKDSEQKVVCDTELVNQIMGEYFAQPYPARAALGVASLPKGALVEMDGIVIIPTQN